MTKSPRKPSTHSDSSSQAASITAPESPVMSLRLSMSMESEDADETYILLDECVSGSSGVSPMMSTSSATPSPGNTLAGRNTAVIATDYMNLDSSGDSKTLDDFLPHSVPSPGSGMSARRSTDAVSVDSAFQSRPEIDDDADVERWNNYSTPRSSNTEFTGHSKSGDDDVAPALPAKKGSLDAEYDVPVFGPIHVSPPHPASNPMHGASAAPPPPHPHMAVPGRMHRYVNSAPTPVRSQGPKAHG